METTFVRHLQATQSHLLSDCRVNRSTGRTLKSYQAINVPVAEGISKGLVQLGTNNHPFWEMLDIGCLMLDEGFAWPAAALSSIQNLASSIDHKIPGVCESLHRCRLFTTVAFFDVAADYH